MFLNFSVVDSSKGGNTRNIGIEVEDIYEIEAVSPEMTVLVVADRDVGNRVYRVREPQTVVLARVNAAKMSLAAGVATAVEKAKAEAE